MAKPQTSAMLMNIINVARDEELPNRTYSLTSRECQFLEFLIDGIYDTGALPYISKEDAKIIVNLYKSFEDVNEIIIYYNN